MLFEKLIKFVVSFFLYTLLFSIPFFLFFYKNIISNKLSIEYWSVSFFPAFLATLYMIHKRKLKSNLLNQLINIKCTKVKDLFIVLIMGILLPVIVVLIHLYFLNNIEINLKINYSDFIFDLLVFFPLLFLSAFFEELGFRFIIYEDLPKILTYKNLFLISITFGIFHLFNPNFSVIGIINVIFAGVLFSVIYLQTNNILFSSIIHFLWNYIIGCVFSSNVSGLQIISICDYKTKGNIIFNGGEFGLEGSLITSIVLIIAIVLLKENRFLLNNEIEELEARKI
jgi:membrane protease YdiL (CAAX protease family)